MRRQILWAKTNLRISQERRSDTMGNMTSQERLAYAIRQLRMYNKIIRYGVPEQTFQIPEIEAGLDSPFDSDAEKKAKKMLVAASTEAIISNPAIPKIRKEKMARKNAEEIQLAFDAVKTDFAEISAFEREERIKSNAIANRAKKLKRVEKSLKRKGTKMALNAAVTAIAATVGAPVVVSGGVIYGIVTLIPDKWKKTIKEKATDFVDKAARKMDNLVDKFKETKVGKKLVEVGKKINESKVVKTIRETTERIGNKIEEKYNQVREKVNNGARKVWDFVKSWF